MSHADTHVLMLAASGSLHTRRWACDLATSGYAITLLTADPSEPPAFAKAYATAGVAVERVARLLSPSEDAVAVFYFCFSVE